MKPCTVTEVISLDHIRRFFVLALSGRAIREQIDR